MSGFNSSVGRVSIKVDTSRFTEHQFREAQKKLNMLIVGDSQQYVPFAQGQLRSQVDYPDGIYGGKIRYYASYAHYQYEGELYVTESGSSWANSGEAKHPSGRGLRYHEPGTGDHWFDRAAQTHKNEWIKAVKRVGGGGVNA